MRTERPSDSSGVLEGAPPVKMVEEVAFVWLVPTDLIGWQWSNVEAIDVRGIDECLNQVWVFCDCRDY